MERRTTNNNRRDHVTTSHEPRTAHTHIPHPTTDTAHGSRRTTAHTRSAAQPTTHNDNERGGRGTGQGQRTEQQQRAASCCSLAWFRRRDRIDRGIVASPSSSRRATTTSPPRHRPTKPTKRAPAHETPVVRRERLPSTPETTGRSGVRKHDEHAALTRQAYRTHHEECMATTCQRQP
ncbi:hypothetical protein BD410DRAFT_509765 [Rickenella mellea]|uniref:Uncharacterized protein n=1 Tax=Rickenella mellea TaxID=50990 RepID=A0A4Y7PSS3_9AGAM|nr:hypothetical protein BD410DRAFT_509765 [Rickenella mellea]